MKNNGEEHYEFVQCNVSVDVVNDNKMEYAKFAKLGLNNHVS